MSGAPCTLCKGAGRYRRPYSSTHIPCPSCADGRRAAALGDLTGLARRVASLNPNCAEIGAGMLTSLVQDARAALKAAGEVQS